jgi:YVTN family beta-propeller protein
LSLCLAVLALQGTLVVLNKSEASASLIDLATEAVVATVATGEGPHEVAVSPDGRRALATNYGTQARRAAHSARSRLASIAGRTGSPGSRTASARW